jgi:hypothetical protein
VLVVHAQLSSGASVVDTVVLVLVVLVLVLVLVLELVLVLVAGVEAAVVVSGV